MSSGFKILLIGALALGVSTAFSSAAAVTVTSGTPTVVPPAPTDSVAGWIEAINTSSDPSAAVDAYSHGLALDSKNVPLTEAYIRRMLGFGMPQMAARQAQTLLDISPGNALALAVLGFDSAQNGDMTAAFSQVLQAVQKTPDDPFAQAVAGQLVAWYDFKSDRPGITPGISDAVEQLREKLADRAQYKDAYSNALAMLKRMPAESASATSPPATQPAPSGQVAEGSAVATSDQLGQNPTYVYPPTTYYTPDYNAGYYPYTSYSPYYGSYYPYDYYGSPYFWPYATSGFFFDDGFFPRRHFFDHDDFFVGHGFFFDRDHGHYFHHDFDHGGHFAHNDFGRGSGVATRGEWRTGSSAFVSGSGTGHSRVLSTGPRAAAPSFTRSGGGGMRMMTSAAPRSSGGFSRGGGFSSSGGHFSGGGFSGGGGHFGGGGGFGGGHGGGGGGHR